MCSTLKESKRGMFGVHHGLGGSAAPPGDVNPLGFADIIFSIEQGTALSTFIMRLQTDFIHEFVPGNSERTLLLLHGTGGNEHDLIPLGRELDPKAALLSPRGKVLENGMPRFFRRLAEGVFDLDDLKKRTDELADFVASAADHHKIGIDKLVAVGYSNGANIAASMLLLRPEILHYAILFRAMVPLEPDNLPDLSSARVWIGAGNQDPIVSTSETQRLVELLRSAGADVTIRFLNAGHGLTTDEIEIARDWLRTTWSESNKRDET